MKILAISDVPSKALWDYGTREHLQGIDLILSCGDLPKKYLEYLTNFTTVPILYVHGNHDGSYRGDEPGGCICVDDQVFVWNGLRIMGLGGCFRYNQEDTYQYTEAAMRRRARKLWLQAHKVGGIDILLTHAPASGLNDGTDKAHKGFQVFNDLMDQYQPKWFIHGHMHLNYGANLPRVCTRGGTTVINATERYEFEIPDPFRCRSGSCLVGDKNQRKRRTTMEIERALQQLESLQKKLYAYHCADSSLYLDAVTTAPSDTSEGRGVAMSILAGESQKLMTCPETKALLDELSARAGELDLIHRREVEELRRSCEQLTRIPADEYMAYKELCNRADDVWHKAKAQDDFACLPRLAGACRLQPPLCRLL